MDEENKQVTADEVYSYGKSTEEPAGEPEEKAEPEPEATDQRIHRIINSYIRIINMTTASSTARTEMSSQTTLQWI